MPDSASKTVAIVGLGYVGLPLAALSATRGWRVLGIDIDPAKVAALQEGRLYLRDERVEQQLTQYPIEATTSFAAAQQADVIVVAVPTPVTADKQPDLVPLRAALLSLRPELRAGQVVIVESTINPGVMDDVVVPLLAERTDLRLDARGARAGAVYLAHCPERVNPGDARWHVGNIPRVLGGYSKAGAAAALAFYESILDAPVKVMASVTEAEAVKIFENTFRDVNIAFVNEMAKSFTKLGIDVTNVIAGASSKPFGFLPHYPGNGVGGHCISVDPYYMIERGRSAGFNHEFLKLARRINDSMPEHSVELLTEGLAQLGTPGAAVALLGLAYKKNVADVRESPALRVRELLEERNAGLAVYDPFLPERSTVTSVAAALEKATVVMLACDHDELVAALTPPALAAAGVRLVVDGKNALDGEALAAAGIIYYGIGRQFMPPAQMLEKGKQKRASRMQQTVGT